MPQAKLDTGRYPRTWVFNTLGVESIGPLNFTTTVANSVVAAAINLPCAVKVVKVGVSWTSLTGAPAFNLVYNTVQALGSAQTFTQGNVAPMDNSYTAGITSTPGGQYALASATPTNLQGLGAGSPGFPNPALTTAQPNFQQVQGLGIPTNVAVDGQPLFYNDVILNTANFPGSGTTGGQGVIVPTNWDAVYPAGIYPYGQQQGSALYQSDFGACITLRTTITTTTQIVSGLTVTLFLEPILLSETTTGSTTTIIPGNGQIF